MDAQAIALIITAIGGGAAIGQIIKGLAGLASGVSQRERAKNTGLIAQRTKAIEERIAAEKDRDEKVAKAESELDQETVKRREAEEHVSMLKRQVYELGATPVERN